MQFSLEPGEVAVFIRTYSLQEVEQLGSAEYQARSVWPTGRDISVMAVERLVVAEKM